VETKEIYILSKDRTMSTAQIFLDSFLPERFSLTEEYPYPQYSDTPEIIFENRNELIQKLVTNSNEPYSLYWDVVDSEVINGMIFFTKDGGMIVGLAVAQNKDEYFLKSISEAVGGEFGYISFDSPPPETQDEFITLCKDTDQAKLFLGKFINEGG